MTKLNRIKFRDLVSPLYFLILLPFLFVHRIMIQLQNRKIILISEDPYEANDNGYVFFKFMLDKNDPEFEVYYAISKTTRNRYKIPINNRIDFYSIKHWFYYFNAEFNLSIHKASSPAPALFYVLQKYKIFNGKRIFLQHGITMNNVSYLHKKECHFKFFVTAARPENKFIMSELGYQREEMLPIGFPRFDELDSSRKKGSIIAVMPTWRKYLGNLDEKSFLDSEYYRSWSKLLNNKALSDLLEEHNLQLYFYLHRNFKKYSCLFTTENSRIITQAEEVIDIQTLIQVADLMITDYSSISIDAAYNETPVIYYQFDENKFYKSHLKMGYFNYRTDGFGPVYATDLEVLSYLNKIIKLEFKVENDYSKRLKDFFFFTDNNNCERLYKVLKGEYTHEF